MLQFCFSKVSKFFPLFPPHFKSNFTFNCHYSATFCFHFRSLLPSIDSISLHSILLPLSFYFASSTITIFPLIQPPIALQLVDFNYYPLSHHKTSIPLYSTHTNTHNNTIVIIIAPRHSNFSYCSS